MTLPICKLSVTRFRSLRELEAGPFGRVNLITGKNNSGKSSLLEAIRILVNDGAPSTLYSILNYREESSLSAHETSVADESSPWFRSLFSDFPDLGGCSQPFSISNTNGGTSPIKSVAVSVGWFGESADPETGRRILTPSEQLDIFGEISGTVPMLLIQSPSRPRRIRLDQVSAIAARRVMFEGGEGGGIPCVFLDPFSSRSTSQLGKLWDAIALTEAEKQVVEALRIISPDIEAVSMIGSDDGRRSRTAIAKSRLFRAPVPLRTFGDGVTRLFGIILSLANAAGGVLLIDEIENGLHHSILADVWKVIFQMATALNVQVFATSHSWDCIVSFQDAATTHPEDGVLARLTARGDKVISTIFTEHDLQIAARDQIELR